MSLSISPTLLRARTSDSVIRAERPKQEYHRNTGPCRVDGCDKPRHQKGWCNRHFNLWRYHGDPLWIASPTTHKTCKWCREVKSVSEFYHQQKSWRSYCKSCYRLSLRNKHLQTTYGMTSEQYEQMLDAPGHVCAVCKGDTPYPHFDIDHDHRCCSGKKSCGKCVRGLLCRNCNRFIGMAKDDSVILRAGAAYLERNGV